MALLLLEIKQPSSPGSKIVLCGFCLAEGVAPVLYPSSFSIAYLDIALLITVIQSFTKKRLIFFKEDNHLKTFFFKVQTTKLTDFVSCCIFRSTCQITSNHCFGGISDLSMYLQCPGPELNDPVLNHYL